MMKHVTFKIISFRSINMLLFLKCLYGIKIICITEFEITSSDIFLLSLGAVEDRNKRERASPKSIADTCVQYCHLGCP